MKALLDTHVLLWWLEGGKRLSRAQQRLVRQVSPERPLWVSDISPWEIATLWQLGRLRLSLPLRDWLERATAPPLVQRCGITPAVAAEVAALPASLPRDPADRILVATARVLGATLVTRDRRLIEAEAVAILD
ncbi:MAG: type II toxin-antitoxin system VapC family toxin [Thermoanaerobaculia bacterium]